MSFNGGAHCVVLIAHMPTGRSKCQGVVGRSANALHIVRAQKRLARPLTSVLKDQQHSLPKALVRPALRRRLAEASCREASVHLPLPGRVGVLLCIQTRELIRERIDARCAGDWLWLLWAENGENDVRLACGAG